MMQVMVVAFAQLDALTADRLLTPLNAQPIESIPLPYVPPMYGSMASFCCKGSSPRNRTQRCGNPALSFKPPTERLQACFNKGPRPLVAGLRRSLPNASLLIPPGACGIRASAQHASLAAKHSPPTTPTPAPAFAGQRPLQERAAQAAAGG